MTTSPEEPRLTEVPEDHPLVKAGVFKASECKMLADDYLAVVPMMFGLRLRIVVRKGYITNGASVPAYLPERIFGDRWAMPRIIAALLHDALYSVKWKFRWLADRVYLWCLKDLGYPCAAAHFEYDCIRIAGWRSWRDIPSVEKKWAKPLVSTEVY